MIQYWADVLNTFLIFAIFSASLNLLVGYAGQFSVTQAALGGVGGYTAAFLSLHAHLGTWAGLACGTAIAAVAGLVVALPALSLTSEYLILLTVAAATIIITIAQTAPQLGGVNGLVLLAPPSLAPIPPGVLGLPSDWCLPLAVLAAAAIGICWRIGHSPYGRVLRSARDDELAAQSLGKNVFAFKIGVFVITAAVAGFAGALLCYYNQLAAPGVYSFNVTLTIFAMVIVGGMGNLGGSLAGTAILVLLRPMLEKTVRLGPDQASLWQLILYGAGLVAFMLLRPRGLFPERPGAARLRPRRVPAAPGRSTVPGSTRPLVAAAGRPRPDDRGSGDDTGPEAVLEVRNLAKQFGGIAAVNGLSFTLRPGRVSALIGPNGAGKTTVFNLITGAVKPDRGKVLLRGDDVTGLRPDQLARRGVVRSFQDVRTFGRLSALENVMTAVQGQRGERLLPLFAAPKRVTQGERATRDAAMRWLEYVGLADRAGVAVASLGFGEQKLIALARALAAEADVLLLDEPASGVEAHWLDTIVEVVGRISAEGRSVCIIEHSIELVNRIADNVYFMELGRMTAEGPMQTLLTDRRLAEAYFGPA
jgi:branched-chain amino acid transport system permease protein